jgi:toxin ParE1/3/4
MPTVLRTSRAHLDLVEAALHIAEENPTVADHWLDLIDEKCESLSRLPELGRKRPDLAPGLRSLPAGNYVIFYRPITDGIEVIRVLHGARDIPALFD